MKVTINNKEAETQAKTIRELAQELDLPATGVAVAISNEMVPRDEWENTIITEGADIVIVKAFAEDNGPRILRKRITQKYFSYRNENKNNNSIIKQWKN